MMQQIYKIIASKNNKSCLCYLVVFMPRKKSFVYKLKM